MNRFLLFAFLLTVAVFGTCRFAAAEVSVIPRPLSVEETGGFFTLTADAVIAADAESSVVAEFLAGLVAPATGFGLKVVDGSAGAVRLAVDGVVADRLGPEGYTLVAGADGVEIRGGSASGVFYGVQTLRQLLPAEIESGVPVSGVAWRVPCVRVEDAPRFKWRGLMLDVGRHFFPKEFVMKYIDTMAMYKMNSLHIHLTEDQGWRIEIKAFPALTKIGAWRSESKIRDELTGSPAGPAHGGFFTQDDMREIIAFAESRFVNIVPEIEMPGHAQAAIASIRGLSCVDKKFPVSRHWGVHREVYCAGKEKVFNFLETVLSEVVELFPGEYVHIGGDEVPKERWRACPDCQARIKAEGLKNEDELQSYFIKRIENFMDSKGKRIIGWDEILEGGLPPRATVMSWRGIKGGIQAAIEGHDVVMSPTSHCYFDYKQAEKGEPNPVGSLTTLEETYSYEPVPDVLTPEQAKHVLGTQGNLWTERVDTQEHAMYMTYPRAIALSEVGWTRADLKSWPDFAKRVLPALDRLDALGVNNRKPTASELP